jgi:DNA-binding response OmpR family regulator
MEAGMDECLSKPINTQSLYAAVKHQIQTLRRS